MSLIVEPLFTFWKFRIGLLATSDYTFNSLHHSLSFDTFTEIATQGRVLRIWHPGPDSQSRRHGSIALFQSYSHGLTKPEWLKRGTITS